MVYILNRMLLAGLLAGSCWSALGAEPVAAAGAPQKRLNGPHPVAVPLTIHHAGQQPRHVIVRVSAPVAPGLLTGPLPPAVTLGEAPPTPAQACVITRHPDGSARRVMLSFPAKVLPGKKLSAEYPASTSGRPAAAPLFAANRMRTAKHAIVAQPEQIEIRALGDDALLATLRPWGPTLADAQPAALEILENGPYFAWLRWNQSAREFDRQIDLQVDALGRMKCIQRIQSHLGKDAWCPDFGFEFRASRAKGPAPSRQHFLALDSRGSFAAHPELTLGCTLADGASVAVANPLALRQHRGTLESRQDREDVVIRLARLEPIHRETDGLMIQDGQWRIVECLVQPGSSAELADAIDHPIEATAAWAAYDAVYHTGKPLEVHRPELRAVVEQYIDYLQRMSIDGDDWGNMTSYSPVNRRAAVASMNRFNHCQYVWEDYYRSGDPRLRRIAADWSENYRNLSVYWGNIEKYYGGTRRGRADRNDPTKAALLRSYMRRYEYTSDYVTKGFHNFWLAYEETGDPRFRQAAEAQAQWSAANAHCDRGETRNVGLITDFARLYSYTGRQEYLDQAQRLWREFQSKQAPDLLFTQSGKPATGNDLYIRDDDHGYKFPFYKPYMVQYATNSLPHLLECCPADRHLRATILACNDWMARVQTEAGGWGYPGPTTAGLGLSLEYVHGMGLALGLEAKPEYLDAIRRTLRTIVVLAGRHGMIPGRIASWESQQGVTITPETYRRGVDRDRSRDYREGRVEFDQSPDSAVYFQVVLREYLKHRSEESLFEADPVLEQLLKLPTSAKPRP
jgi:hypothetical protein